MISWKGFGRGDRGLTGVLYRRLSGETEENFINITALLNETDAIRRNGTPGVQIQAEMHTFYLHTDPWSHPSSLKRTLGPTLPASYAMWTAGYISGGKATGA